MLISKIKCTLDHKAIPHQKLRDPGANFRCTSGAMTCGRGWGSDSEWGATGWNEVGVDSSQRQGGGYILWPGFLRSVRSIPIFLMLGYLAKTTQLFLT